MKKLRLGFLTAMMSCAAAFGSPVTSARADDGDKLWLTSGQNPKNWRNQADEHKISPANAGQLAPKWVFTTGGDVSATPAVDESFVYVPDAAGNLFKINRRTGVQIWARTIA